MSHGAIRQAKRPRHANEHALALVINITLSSLRSMRLEVLSARKNGARGEMERLPERPMKIVTTRFLGVRKFPLG